MKNLHLDPAPKKINLTSNHSEVGLLAIHGRNQTADFMLEQLQKIDWHKLPCLLPEAADKTWYKGKFMDAIAQNQPELDFALATIEHYLQEMETLGFPAEKMILMGFSQGACLLSEYLVRKPQKFKAVFILTGGYLGEEGTVPTKNGSLSQTPVYITTSQIDEWVPARRTEETAKFFEEIGAKVTLQIFENRPHEISEAELDYIKKSLNI